MSDAHWRCVKCGETPNMMHSMKPEMICVPCYNKSLEGLAMPTYGIGDRVTTPDGNGEVHYLRLGDTVAESTVNVILDANVRNPNHRGTFFPCELVKAQPKRVSRNRRGQA